MGFWRRYRFPFLITIFLLAGLVLFSLNAGKDVSSTVGGRLLLEITGPVQGVFTWVGDGIGDLWRRYFALVSAAKENERLGRELAAMRQELVVMEELRQANRRLKNLLDFKEAAAYPLVASEVVASDPTNYFRTAIINRGSDDGVMTQMPVVHTQGLVGRIIWSSPNYSKVLLLTDPNSGVDVMVQRSRARGVVEGAGKGRLRLKYLQQGLDITPGDKLITSGAAGVFPPGILVGEVRSVEKEGTGLFQKIDVDPAVDFDHLEEALIILQRRRLAE